MMDLNLKPAIAFVLLLVCLLGIGVGLLIVWLVETFGWLLVTAVSIAIVASILREIDR
jgi:hypothetical protein